MADDLTELGEEQLRERIADVQSRVRPVEAQLRELRTERDVLQTELRRRERLVHRELRRDLKAQMKEGQLSTIADLVASADAGSFDDYRYNLKTGGEVRLGFPNARQQTLAFTDGRRTAQARDLTQSAELFAAGWSFGAPAHPGVRVHFPGSRLERLVAPEEVFIRPASE
jgi:hypothetical protein